MMRGSHTSKFSGVIGSLVTTIVHHPEVYHHGHLTLLVTFHTNVDVPADLWLTQGI